ncbi:MAG: DUF4157 domain-containing protein [Candidatus Korobacteraceae bacterium]
MTKQNSAKSSYTPSSALAAQNGSATLERQHSFGPHVCVQREAAGRTVQPSAPSLVREVVNSPGQPLDANTRAFMEPRLGHNLSSVRVHTDHKAAESAHAVSANAYTAGTHIAFAPGRYEPGTMSGRQLLAHELTHSVQQSTGPVAGRKAAEGLSVSDPSDRFERAARQRSIEVTSTSDADSHMPPARKPLKMSTRSGSFTVQRQDDPSADKSAATSAKASIFSAVFAGVSAVEAIRQANYASRQAEAAEDPPVQTPTTGGLVSNDVEIPEVKGVDLDADKKVKDETKETDTVVETITYPKMEGVPGSGETHNPRTITKQKTVSKESAPAEQESRFLVLRLQEGATNSADFWLTLRHNSKDIKGGTTEMGDVKGYLGGTLNSNASVNFRASPGAPEKDTGKATARLLFGGTNVPPRERLGSTASGVFAFLTGGISGSGGAKKNEDYKVQRFSASVRFNADGKGAFDDKAQPRVSDQGKPPKGDGSEGSPFLTVSLNAAPAAASGQQAPAPAAAPQKAGGAAPAPAAGGAPASGPRGGGPQDTGANPPP